MSRMLLPLLALCVACSLAACGSDDDKVKILVFQAAPDAIEAGQSTKLVFAVEPADAKVSITGLGDLTGQTQAQVTPSTTTTYQLTATSGSATANETVKVTVGMTAASTVRIEAATTAPTAGDAVAVTLTVLAKDGKTATGFRGMLALSSSDGQAALPGDLAFAEADAGVKHAMVTLKTAGSATLTATDKTSAAAGSTTLTVRPGPARAYQLSKLPDAAIAGDALALTITVRDAFGNVATSYDGKARLVSTDASDVLSPGGTFSAGVLSLGLTFTRAGNHVAEVQDVAAVIPSAITTSVGIGAAKAARLAATTASASATAGEPQTLTAAVLDRFGNVATDYTGTVQFTASDARAVLPDNFAFTAGDAGHHDFTVALKTAGPATVTVADIAAAALTGSASWAVSPAAASAFVLSPLPASATAGQALVLTITVQDAFANTVTAFAGVAAVTSGDPSDVLPPVDGFSGGVRTVSVAFTRAGSHTATVADPASAVAPATTSSVSVSAASPFRVAVTTASAASIAGTTQSLTTRIVDFFDNTVVNYAGTLHFAATDARAVLPADTAFSPSDAGTRDFSVTLKTSGTTTLSISDAAVAGLSGTASWTVGAAGAAACVAVQAPATATAGSVLGLTVAVQDAFGNAATGYAGTIALAASDARASLPASVTYLPGTDAGSHAFSVALVTAGSQTVTATDVANGAIQCSTAIAITPASPLLVLTAPADANAGFAVDVAVAVKDRFDNAIPTYAGTVTFTSTDTGAGAVTPGPIAFTGSEGGRATTSATFVTVGAQTLAASDGGTPQATGSKVAAVHGLVYTAPAAGRVRLVANPVSNARVVQLDLVASERLEISSFFLGPGSFSAGMNLPLDTTRVGAGSPLFTRGAALPVGAGVPAQIAVIGADHVLYTGVSRKRVIGTAVATQDTEVQAGQVFYSVRLALLQQSSVGAVFDGAQPMAMFRAAVRDQFGDDFVGQVDFGVGKLEVR